MLFQQQGQGDSSVVDSDGGVDVRVGVGVGTNGTCIAQFDNETATAAATVKAKKKKEKKKKKAKVVVIPKEPEIIIIKEKKVVQVKHIRNELTHEQLQRIHKEEGYEYDSSSSSSSLSSTKPIPSTETIQERMTIESKTKSYYQSIIDSIHSAEREVQQLQNHRDIIQSHVMQLQEQVESNELLSLLSLVSSGTLGTSGASSSSSSSGILKKIRKMDPTVEKPNVGIPSLVSFLSSTSSSSSSSTNSNPNEPKPMSMSIRNVPTENLKHNIYEPIYKEIQTIIHQYQNGIISVHDFASILEDTDFSWREYGNGNGHGNTQVCDVNFLTTTMELDKYGDDWDYGDDDDYYNDDDYEDDDEDDYLEDREEEEEDDEEYEMIKMTYASHEDLSSNMKHVLSSMEEKLSYAPQSDGESKSLLPLPDEKLFTLEKNLLGDLESHLSGLIEERESKFVQLKTEVAQFQSKVEALRMKSFNANTNNVVVESGSCAKEYDVEYMMKHALKNVIHDGMDVDKAMRLIITSYNKKYGGANGDHGDDDDDDDDEEYNNDSFLLNEDELEELKTKPFFRELRQKLDYEGNMSDNDGDKGKRTLKELMNAPMVPQTIRAFDEGIEMVAGYNEALDQAIDFIAGLNADDDDNGVDEGTVGKTIETGLYHLLDKVEFPDQFYDMKKKAGILLQ